MSLNAIGRSELVQLAHAHQHWQPFEAHQPILAQLFTQGHKLYSNGFTVERGGVTYAGHLGATARDTPRHHSTVYFTPSLSGGSVDNQSLHGAWGADPRFSILNRANQQAVWMPFVQVGAVPSALQRDQYIPISEEFDFAHAGTNYRAQLGYHVHSGQQRVYFVKVHDWGNVQFEDVVADSGKEQPIVPDNPDQNARGVFVPEWYQLQHGNGLDWDNLMQSGVNFAYVQVSDQFAFHQYVQAADQRGLPVGITYALQRGNIPQQLTAISNVVANNAVSLPMVLRVMFDKRATTQLQTEDVQTFIDGFLAAHPSQSLVIQTRKLDWDVLIGRNSQWATNNATRFALWLEDTQPTATQPDVWTKPTFQTTALRTPTALQTVPRLSFGGTVMQLMQFAVSGISFSYDMAPLIDLRDYLTGDGPYSIESVLFDADGNVETRQDAMSSEVLGDSILLIRNGRKRTIHTTNDTIYHIFDDGYLPDSDRQPRKFGSLEDGEGAAWLSTTLREGELSSYTNQVHLLSEKTLKSIRSTTRRISWRMMAHHTEFTMNDTTLEDVVELVRYGDIEDAPVARYYFAKGIGLVGWDGSNGFGRFQATMSNTIDKQAEEAVLAKSTA